jgi:hypothetical protein
MNKHYSEKILIEGSRYTVGMNDGCTFPLQVNIQLMFQALM